MYRRRNQYANETEGLCFWAANSEHSKTRTCAQKTNYDLDVILQVTKSQNVSSNVLYSRHPVATLNLMINQNKKCTSKPSTATCKSLHCCPSQVIRQLLRYGICVDSLQLIWPWPYSQQNITFNCVPGFVETREYQKMNYYPFYPI